MKECESHDSHRAAPIGGRAVEGFVARMMGGTGAANQAWATKRQRTEGPNPKRFKNNSRPGYHDGAARLADMDLDGVQTEVVQVTDEMDNSDLRWTVDTADDLAHVRRLYRDLDLAGQPLPYGDVVRHVRQQPAARDQRP